MLGAKAPNYDTYGLLRATHSHNPPQYSHIVGYSPHFHAHIEASHKFPDTPSFLCKDDPVGRNLEQDHKPQQDPGPSQKGHTRKADKIGHIHGISGKPVKASPVKSRLVRERKIYHCRRK